MDRAAGGTPQITFTQSGYEMDTIKVKVTRPSPGFFAKVFGSAFGSVTVSGSATARAYNVQGIQNGIAPITVNYKHPLLNCTRGQNPTCSPTFGTPTQLSLEDMHTSGGKDAAGCLRADQPQRRSAVGTSAPARWPTGS